VLPLRNWIKPKPKQFPARREIRNFLFSHLTPDEAVQKVFLNADDADNADLRRFYLSDNLQNKQITKIIYYDYPQSVLLHFYLSECKAVKFCIKPLPLRVLPLKSRGDAELINHSTILSSRHNLPFW
jgi:hypothetical protein